MLAKLYKLVPMVEWTPWYDTVQGFVVRAYTEEEARQYAAARAGDEGSDAWLDPKKTSCVELLQDGPVGVILRDFAAA